MPALMPAQKRQDIRDAIASGMRIEDIRELLSTSAGSVVKIKREMGIPIQQQRRRKDAVGPVESVARVAAQVVPGPPAPPVLPASTVPRPEAYVTAFENRVLEYRELLRQYNQTLLERDGTIERLKRELATLRDEYAQTVFRQQNWQGPTSTMTQSLGNGG